MTYLVEPQAIPEIVRSLLPIPRFQLPYRADKFRESCLSKVEDHVADYGLHCIWHRLKVWENTHCRGNGCGHLIAKYLAYLRISKRTDAAFQVLEFKAEVFADRLRIGIVKILDCET
jgi:hypothetical protein